MNDSTKKKPTSETPAKKRVVVKGSSLSGAVGVVETPSQLEEESEERKNYWKDSIETIRGEKFSSVEAAVDRVVELSSEKLGVVAGDPDTQAFMKQALMDNDEVLDVLNDLLEIQD